MNALTEMISLFGSPTRVIFDQAGSFTGKAFIDYCNKNNIKTHAIATGAARANAQVERVMLTITNLITVALSIKKQSIKSLMPRIQLVINSTVNRITGKSPIELLTGKNPILPSSIQLSEDVIPPTRSDLNEIRSIAKQNIDRSAAYETKRYANRGAPVVPFQIGDLVLRHLEPRLLAKTDQKFKGTYKIVQVLDNDRYLIEHLLSGRQLKYVHERLRKIESHDEVLPQMICSSESEQSDVE